MTSRGDISILLDLLCLDKEFPGGNAREAASQWRSASDAPDLLRLLEYEGAELWLYRRLKAMGFTSAPAFDQSLREAAHHGTILTLRIDDTAASVLTAFRDAAIPCVLIKGQARRAAASIYPWADARTSSDVDLLLPAELARPAWDLLMGSGYSHASEPTHSWAGLQHLPPVWNERRVAVEIHTTSSPHVTATEAWERATNRADQLEWMGLPVTVPSATELLWHGLSHALFNGHAAARLRYLLVGAAVLAAKREIDWDCIRRRIESGEVRDFETGCGVRSDIQYAWLAAAATLAGEQLPAPMRGHRAIPIDLLLQWRRLILGSTIRRAARERLLEEAALFELRLPTPPSPNYQAAWKRGRHTLLSAAARACYQGWRAIAPT